MEKKKFDRTTVFTPMVPKDTSRLRVVDGVPLPTPEPGDVDADCEGCGEPCTISPRGLKQVTLMGATMLCAYCTLDLIEARDGDVEIAGIDDVPRRT